MIDISEEVKELYNEDIGNKQIILEFYKNDTDLTPSYVLGNENIISESMELNEGLSTERNIRFGQCYSSKFSIDIFGLKDKFDDDPDFINYKLKAYIYINPSNDWLYPDGKLLPENDLYPENSLYPESILNYEDALYPDDNLYPNGYSQSETQIPLFVGYVENSVLSDNRSTRKITAYDILQKKLQTDISDLFFNDLLENRTVKYVREKILSYLNINYENVQLANDNLILTRDIFKENANYKVLARKALESILEFCGCFGHIDRNNIFRFIKLTAVYYNYPAQAYSEKAIYPSSSIYPGANDLGTIKREQIKPYISIKYGEYKTATITGVECIDNNNSVVERYTESLDNLYIMRGNIYIEYYLHTTHIESYFAIPLFQQIYNIQYVPTTIVCPGKPYLEVGDYISFTVNNDDSPKYKEIIIPLLSRTLKGIQSLKDTLEAKGNEKRQYQFKI